MCNSIKLGPPNQFELHAINIGASKKPQPQTNFCTHWMLRIGNQMHSRKASLLVIGLLVLAGIVSIGSRLYLHKQTRLGESYSRWRLAYELDAEKAEPHDLASGIPGRLSPVEHHPYQILELRRLPRSMHPVLSVILLIPFGALVSAFFQTMIGLRTIGTFGPTLIALSFVMSDWRTGVVVLALVIAVGLISRWLIDRLKLLMVPKLGFVLTLVVVVMVFTISALDYLRLTPSPQAVLLPMVILTMTIERFYVESEEAGIVSAFQLLLNTAIVSFFCFLILGWQQVGELVMKFPEVHFFTLAILVLLGRYNGYRLSELFRFRDLCESPTNIRLP